MKVQRDGNNYVIYDEDLINLRLFTAALLLSYHRASYVDEKSYPNFYGIDLKSMAITHTWTVFFRYFTGYIQISNNKLKNIGLKQKKVQLELTESLFSPQQNKVYNYTTDKHTLITVDIKKPHFVTVKVSDDDLYTKDILRKILLLEGLTECKFSNILNVIFDNQPYPVRPVYLTNGFRKLNISVDANGNEVDAT